MAENFAPPAPGIVVRAEGEVGLEFSHASGRTTRKRTPKRVKTIRSLANKVRTPWPEWVCLRKRGPAIIAKRPRKGEPPIGKEELC